MKIDLDVLHEWNSVDDGVKPKDLDNNAEIEIMTRNNTYAKGVCVHFLWGAVGANTITAWRHIESEKDTVDVMQQQIGGNHYKKHKIQPWHIVDEYNLDYYLGSALKYLLRHKKGTNLTQNEKRIEDLEKAKHYLEKKISLLKQ